MAPSPITRAYYPTPEGQVHYRFIPAKVKDSSKSPVLLLHMSACSGLYYEALIVLLADAGYDCYAPDIPGLVTDSPYFEI
jgi:pimeloyl-ACP methyl ester carboxylesterase